MKAYEARMLSDKSFNSETSKVLKDLYNHIKEIAEDGRTSTSVQTPKSEHIVAGVIKKLQNDGYVVKRDSYCDPRDSYDNIIISWEHAK